MTEADRQRLLELARQWLAESPGYAVDDTIEVLIEDLEIDLRLRLASPA